MTRCTHVDQIDIIELPQSVEGCEECLRTGDAWLHLRICLTFGHVGAAMTRRTSTRPSTTTKPTTH
jgi:hypothetical protein